MKRLQAMLRLHEYASVLEENTKIIIVLAYYLQICEYSLVREKKRKYLYCIYKLLKKEMKIVLRIN